MIVNATQCLRQIAVFTNLGDDRLLLHRFTGRESLSQLFRFDLEMLASDAEIRAADLVGTPVTFRVERQEHEPRYFNGYISNCAYAGQNEFAVNYRATVVPWLWFLTKSSDCRIFQNLNTPQIVTKVFQSLGFDDYEMSGLAGEYIQREYCVQYRETDFEFVSRLLEEEGIYYYFRHEYGKHTLVLADSVASYFPLDEAELRYPAPGQSDTLGDRISAWEHECRFRPGRWAQTDYDFKKPHTSLMSREPALLPHQSRQDLEIYDFPGRFEDTDAGRSLTRLRMQEDEVPHDMVSGSATYRSLTPGGTFSIAEHRSAAEVGQSYVLTAVEHAVSIHDAYGTGERPSDELQFEGRFRCIPKSIPFRPARRTRRPVVEGPQTAGVVGPAGEEIHVDAFARVKCQFHWDREGRHDENSSCWIRVSQEHAGKGWGAIDIPRVGEEVLVSFLEGDPDRPIIKGRVYNAETSPPFSLRGSDNSKHKTRSGGKTDTYQGSGYNEMTMDDTPGKEQLRINAQHDLDANVNQHQTLAVAVDKTEDVGNNDELTVAVDAETEVGNNQTTVVGNNENVVAGNQIVIEAGTAITLACGASTIHMNQAGVITISGTFVTSAATASNSVIAPMTQITGSSVLTQAGLVCFDLGGFCHIKGKQTSIDAAQVKVGGDPVVVKGAPIKLGEVGAPIVTVPPPPGNPGGGGGGGGDGAGGGAGGGSGGAGGSSDSSPSGSTPPAVPVSSGAPGEVASTNEPFDAKQAWADINQKVEKILSIEDPIERNEQITAAYAEAFRRNPEQTWFGTAAFASDQVGQGMQNAQWLMLSSSTAMNPVGDLQGDMATTVYENLATGNGAVFAEIYPSYLFASEHGMEALWEHRNAPGSPVADLTAAPPYLGSYHEILATSPAIDFYPHPVVLGMALNSSVGASPTGLAPVIVHPPGSLVMLEFEQLSTLQNAVYNDPDFSTALQLNEFANNFVTGVMGVQETALTFTADGYPEPRVVFTGTNLADPNQRMPFAAQVAQRFEELWHNDRAMMELELGQLRDRADVSALFE